MGDCSPAELIAILVAARRSKDWTLERNARKLLRQNFGIKLSFAQSLRSVKSFNRGGTPNG